MFGYIDVNEPKKPSLEVRQIPPETPCIVRDMKAPSLDNSLYLAGEIFKRKAKSESLVQR